MIRYLITLIVLCLSVVSFASETPCLDPLACNFMEEGECFFTDENGEPCVTEGCTIQGACNYDPEADIYDGSCEFESCLGCIDAEACNYDETALYDDGTCIYYVDCNGTCGGDWIEDACGNCYGESVLFSEEFNFTESLQYYTVPAGIESIIIEARGAEGGSSTGQEGNNDFAGGLGAQIIGTFSVVEGELLEILVGGKGGDGNCGGGGGGGSFVLNNTSGQLLVVGGGGGGGFHCNVFGGAFGGDGKISTSGGDGIPVGNSEPYPGGTNGEGGTTFHGGGGGGFLSGGSGALNSGDNGNAYPGAPSTQGNGGFGGGGGHYGWCCGGAGGGGGYSGGSGNNHTGAAGGGGSFNSGEYQYLEGGFNSGNGLVIISYLVYPDIYCNPGCTYSQACNYDPESNFDDGSCDYCFCLEGTQWNDSLQGCVSTAPPLMDACGEGTYWDDEAQACLTIVTCSQDLDGDGMIGVEDLMQLLSVFGTNCVFDEPETSGWTCGDPVNYHGYDYATVQIGEQCWFAENLRSNDYENGDAILSFPSDSEWQNTTSGALTVYGEGSDSPDDIYGCYDNSPDINACDPSLSLDEYGRLYNWYAVEDERRLCPSGWHVPTDGEWTVITNHLGGQSVAGGKMKTTYGWADDWNGTNSSGFSGLPGGTRYGSGVFTYSGDYGFWWSSSPTGSSAHYRAAMTTEESIMSYAGGPPTFGYSVRCLKDTE